jgi:hypothetical protein
MQFLQSLFGHFREFLNVWGILRHLKILPNSKILLDQAVLIQKTCRALVEMADLVEEYVEEVEIAEEVGDIEQRVCDLGLWLGLRTPMLEVIGEVGLGHAHERSDSKDSGVGMDDEKDGESGVEFGAENGAVAGTTKEEFEEQVVFASWERTLDEGLRMPHKHPQREKKLPLPCTNSKLAPHKIPKRRKNYRFLPRVPKGKHRSL